MTVATKPMDESTTITVVYHGDEAIDLEESDVETYEEKKFDDPGCWRKYLKPKAGEKITQFEIGVIPPNQMSAIQDIPGINLRIWRAFLASLHDIIDGPTLETTKHQREVPKAGDLVDQEWMNRVFGGANFKVAQEIGALAYKWQQFAGEDAHP